MLPAVWLSPGARTFTGKVIAIIFPITALVAAGFEHSIANMYFVRMGRLLKDEAAALEASGLTSARLAELTWADFLLANLVPVTLGSPDNELPTGARYRNRSALASWLGAAEDEPVGAGTVRGTLEVR